jgi:cadmium resistance protein CadD (predicted permease)
LFPIYLGIVQFISLIKGKSDEEELEQQEKRSKIGMLSIATVTIANGGDNIGTYVPLFASLSPADKSIMTGIFLGMVFIWLTTARYLTTHPLVAKTIARYGHIITPIVLCLLGLFILKENGSFDLLKQ